MSRARHAVDLDPGGGSEASKRRPAIIVSNDAANGTATRLGRGVVTVVPVSSSVERVYPFQVRLPADATGLPRDSKAQAEQVRSVAVQRIGERLGTVPAALMSDLDEALRLHLDLSSTGATEERRKAADASGVILRTVADMYA